VDAIRAALEALRRGDFVLVYDADGREEETDLTLASGAVTPDAIRRMRREAGGLICVTLRGDVRERLGLPFMTDVLRTAGTAYPLLKELASEDMRYDRHSAFSITVNHRDTFTGELASEDMRYDRHSAFSITVNHRDTFTGITDRDRALTISRFAALAEEAIRRENGWAAHAFAREFRSPGHVPLLNAAEPLLEARRGHTELTTALLAMAGLVPSATICEMMADDGRALSKADAKAYARDRNLVFLEGQDIVRAWRAWSA